MEKGSLLVLDKEVPGTVYVDYVGTESVLVNVRIKDKDGLNGQCPVCRGMTDLYTPRMINHEHCRADAIRERLEELRKRIRSVDRELCLKGVLCLT